MTTIISPDPHRKTSRVPDHLRIRLPRIPLRFGPREPTHPSLSGWPFNRHGGPPAQAA